MMRADVAGDPPRQESADEKTETEGDVHGALIEPSGRRFPR